MTAPTGPFRNIGLSKAAQTHRLRKLRAPSKCRECNSYVYFQGAECEEVTLGEEGKEWVEWVEDACHGQGDPAAACTQSCGSLSPAAVVEQLFTPVSRVCCRNPARSSDTHMGATTAGRSKFFMGAEVPAWTLGQDGLSPALACV